MPSFAGLSKFFGRTASEGAAFAAGVAVAPALSPVVREIVNEANAKYQTHPVGVGEAAAIVAENVESLDWGTQEAAFNGVGPGRFMALLGEALNAPGVGELFEAYRRDLIDDAGFTHGLRKAKLETRWDAPLKALKDLRLDPAVIATAVQRGLLPNPGILPVGPPTAEGQVPPMPSVDLDPFTEAKAAGIDADRLKVLARIVGLPASPDLAARMTFRGIIDRVDFDRAISEGNTRNEWAPFLFEGFRQILTAHDGIEGRLRGWLTDAEMYEQTARHGMSQADTDLLFKITGRPLSFHQVFIGLRRGGVYDGPTDQIDPAFLKALRESNIRPEWYSLAWAQRFSYPTAFVLRALTEAGDLTADETHNILLYEGWEPALAEKVSARWATAKKATGATLAGKATTSALTALRGAYVDERMEAPEAQTLMTALGVPAAEQTDVLAVWDIERDVRRKGLSATQIKKAIGQPGHDQTWALARLSELGYTPEDAAAFLAE